MKIKKRLLAFILSLSVLASGFSVMASEKVAVESQKAPTPLSSTAYNILNAFGFIGEDVSLLNGDSALSRAQFVGILFDVAGYPKVSYKAEDLTFIDVTNDTLYKDEIQYFYNAGLINGTSENVFSPSKPITYKQAVKIIVDVLGYKEFSNSSYGSDMTAYIKMAQKLDLIDNVKVGNVDGSLTALNGIQLLYNAGSTRMFEPDLYEKDGSIVYTNFNGEKLFEKNNNIYYNEGLMQDNGVVSLLSEDSNEKAATISGIEYLLSGCDLTGLVGCNVEFHYKLENNVKTLLWAGLKANNNMLEIKAADLATDDGRYDMDTIVYKRNNKEFVVNLDEFADVIYNNSLYNRYTLSHIQPDMGFIRLLDNNDDNKYDLVIVEEYENAFTSGYSSNISFISDKYNKSIKLSDYENIKIYKDGKEVSADEIGTGVLITYVSDLKNNNLVIYVNKDVIQGVVSGKTVEDGKTIINIEDKSYTIAPSYAKLDESKYVKIDPRVGRMYTIYLDKEGNIAEIEEMKDGHLEYAYLIKAMAYDDSYAPQDSAQFRLLLTNGSFVTATSAKKLKINGVPKKTGADILSDPRLWVDGVVDTTVQDQVVRITLNSEGEITDFEFAYDNTSNEYGHDLEKFSLDFQQTASFNDTDNLRAIGERYYLNGKTIFFVKFSGIDVEEPFAVIGAGSFKPESGTVYRVYDSDETHVAGVVSASQDTVFLNDTYIFLVDKVINKKIDGEYVKHVCGYYGGSWVEMPEFSEGIFPSSLKRGDIIRVSQYMNKVTSCTKVLSLVDRPAPMRSGSLSGYPCLFFGYMYSISTTTLCLLSPESDIPTYGKVIPTAVKSTKIPVTIYDVANDTITSATFQDIAQFNTPKKNGEFIPDENSVMLFINRRSLYISEVLVVLY